jgi:hypothetical protein
VSVINTISYSGPAHLFPGGTVNRIVCRRPCRALSIALMSLRPSEAISSGVQIVSANVSRPGISAGAIPAPVATTRKS